ncbi:hypothetical protein BGO18_01210 [Candidatus Saccharibacteria bacterium 47-87]|nr:MAG: hypothetical protein BGO18_01210 [Candidatus Saccharibacteria bacterium 47-87]
MPIRKRPSSNSNGSSTLWTIWRVSMILLGSALAAVGLQFFLLPNHLLDGGVTGVSILGAYVFNVPFAVLLVLFNIPFVYLGYRKFGKLFALYSSIGILTLAALTFNHVEVGFTHEPILAAIFGGIFVGIGAGLVIRYGGTIDGTDTVAILIDRVTIFSVGEAIMVINGIIIALAGFVFGWENALYSLVAYFVAHKAIDVTVEGLNESRSVWVVSHHVREIGAIINAVVDEPVTYVKEANPKDPEPHGVMLAVITRFEEAKIKAAIYAIDKKAFVVISNAHEVIGKETF